MEIMGRNAGWLTGATALAKTEDCDGPDLIYLPEVPFDIDKFLVKVKELLKKKSSIVIAVSEGIRLEDGRYVCELAIPETMWMLSGISSLQEQLHIWQISLLRNAAARQGPWSCLHFREAHPTWLPEWISTRLSWWAEQL